MTSSRHNAATRRDFVRENNDLSIIRRSAVRPYPTIVLFIVHVIVFIVPARASSFFPIALVFQDKREGRAMKNAPKITNKEDYFFGRIPRATFRRH